MPLRSVDIVLRAVGASQAASAIESVGGAAQQSGEQIRAAGVAGAAAGGQIESGANQGAAALNEAGEQATTFRDRLESVRTAGLAIGAVGATLLVLGNDLSEAFVGADRLNGQMQALLSSKGLSGASDDIKNLAGDLAGLTGGDDDEIAGKISSAIVSGRVNGLRELGIALDANAMAEIENAGKVSEAAKSQAILNAVLHAGADAVGSMKENLDPATASIGAFSNRWGNLTEDVGSGAAHSKAALIDGILNPMLDIVDQSPGLKATGGALLYLGGAGGSVIGSVLTLGSQAVITAGGLAQMGATGSLSFAAIQAGAITATAAMLPLLLTIGKIGLVAILAASAIYGLDKLMHAKEDAELKANIAKGDATDEERLKLVNADRAKRGKTDHDRTPITLPQLKAWEADESGNMDPLGKQRANQDFDPEAAKAELTSALNPSAASVASTVASLTAPGAVLPVPGITGGALVPATVGAPISNVAPAAPRLAPSDPGIGGLLQSLMSGGQLFGGVNLAQNNSRNNSAEGMQRGSVRPDGTFEVGAPSYQQTAQGGFKIKFPDLEIPGNSIAQSAGRFFK